MKQFVKVAPHQHRRITKSTVLYVLYVRKRVIVFVFFFFFFSQLQKSKTTSKLEKLLGS